MLRQLFRMVLAVPVVAGTLTSCSTLNVKSDVNTALAGNVRCNTFAWAGSFNGNSALRSTVANPLNESRLRGAIAAHLRTYIQEAPGAADCLVGYGIGSTYVVDPLGPGPYYGYGWGPGWGPGWGGYGWGWPGPYVYREGIIAIDLWDARTRQPIWHASVNQDLYGVSGAEAQKRIDAAVAALFAKYPYAS